MKKFLAILMAAMMMLAVAVPVLAEGEVFLWDNFDDRDPNAKPELAPNGVNLWWANCANLRPTTEDAALKTDCRPKAFDPDDYDSEEDYFAHAADWMANWGEAVNMWALDGISFCKYLNIRIKGAEGGEEKKLISSTQIRQLAKARMWKALVIPGKPEASRSITRSCHSVVRTGWVPSASTRSENLAA